MRNIVFATMITFTTGCPVAMNPEPFALSKEFYEWSCKDYEDYTEILVTTNTCDSEVRFIVAELQLADGNTWKTNLKRDQFDDCEWSENFILTEEFCVEVDGVALTAWID